MMNSKKPASHVNNPAITKLGGETNDIFSFLLEVLLSLLSKVSTFLNITLGVCKAPLVELLKTLGRKITIGIAPKINSVISAEFGFFIMILTINNPIMIRTMDISIPLIAYPNNFWTMFHQCNVFSI